MQEEVADAHRQDAMIVVQRSWKMGRIHDPFSGYHATLDSSFLRVVLDSLNTTPLQPAFVRRSIQVFCLFGQTS